MSRRDFDLLRYHLCSEWRISIPAPQQKAAVRSQSVPPTRRQESRSADQLRIEPSAPTPTQSLAVATPSAAGVSSSRAKSTVRQRDALLCVNCTNKSMIEDKSSRDRKIRQETVAMEQKALRENEERLKRERENLVTKKKVLADDLQEFLHSSYSSKKWHPEDPKSPPGLLISPSADSRGFLMQQRQYREALLKQISQERARRVEIAEEDRRIEMEGLRRLQEQNSVSASTSASQVHAQQSELRRSLLSQMREKLAQREADRVSKESDMAYIKREEARYQETMQKRLEHRKQQKEEMASTLERQLKRNEQRHAEPTGTSLVIPSGDCQLQSCGNCKRLVPRPYLTRPQWV